MQGLFKGNGGLVTSRIQIMQKIRFRGTQTSSIMESKGETEFCGLKIKESDSVEHTLRQSWIAKENRSLQS